MTAGPPGAPILGSGDRLAADPPAVVFVSLPVGLGGSTRSLANLLDHLAGDATRVLAAPPRGRFVGLVVDGGRVEWHLPVVDVGERWAVLRRARTALRLARGLRPHRRRVRALHANGLNELSVALPAALMWRLPVVVWVHNFSPGRALRLMGRAWPLLGRRATVRWAAVSPLARDLVVDAGLATADDVAIVPNPIDPADVVADGSSRPSAATRAGPGAGPTVAFLGTPREYKGFHYLPELVARTSERTPVRWLVFSRQTDDHLPGTWRQLRDLEAAGKLSIEGKLDDVGQAYARCDVVVCPSVSESFCRVAAEAMLNGIPVVGSDLAPVRALLDPPAPTGTAVDRSGAAGLLFPVGDLEAAADAIGRLARDPELRQRLGAVGRARAAAAFGPAAVRRRFLPLLGLAAPDPAPDAEPAAT